MKDLKASMSNSNAPNAEVTIKNTLHGNVSRMNTLQCNINTGKTLIIVICLMMVVTKKRPKIHKKYYRTRREFRNVMKLKGELS